LEFCDISHVLEAITAKRMKIDLYCQWRHCSPLNALLSDVQVTLISSSAMGCQTSVGGENASVSLARWHYGCCILW